MCIYCVVDFHNICMWNQTPPLSGTYILCVNRFAMKTYIE